MSRHYPGYDKSRANVEAMDLDSLLSLIDDLYGRNRLRYGDGIEAVRNEAFRQLDQEWTDRGIDRERGHRPMTQRDFIPVNPPPRAPIDLRGDTRPAVPTVDAAGEPHRHTMDYIITAPRCLVCKGTGIQNGDLSEASPLCRDCDGTGIAADPLPLPPGTTDADLPMDPTGPVSPALLAASWKAGQRRVDGMTRDMARWAERYPGEAFVERRRHGLRHPDPTPEPTGRGESLTLRPWDHDAPPLGEDARIRAALADGTYHDSTIPGRRYPVPATDYDDGGMSMSLITAPTADNKRDTFPLAKTPAVTARATDSPAAADTRYVEGIAHVSLPQGVADASFCRSRESHLLAKVLQNMDDPTDAVEAAERAGESDWQLVVQIAWLLFAFAAGGALVGWVDWLRAVGRI